MKELLQKKSLALKVAVALLLLVLLATGMVLILDWPLSVRLLLVILVAGAVFASLFFLRVVWQRHREKLLADELMGLEKSRPDFLAERDGSESKELEAQWKHGIEALRRSQLKKYGNPLYVLPWFLAIGRSGSGKSTVLHNAHLYSYLAEEKKAAGSVPTRNCDWCFLDKMIVIDTTGRYLDGETLDQEWRKLLRLLAGQRRREPLNGVVVTVAADHLLGAEQKTMADDAVSVRSRINEMMALLGVRFPVYVLVTKCDLIPGMSDFIEGLPEDRRAQAVGFINDDPSMQVESFAGHAFAAIAERLCRLRLHLLLRCRPAEVPTGLLLFPREFQRFTARLCAFLASAFNTNHYLETPIFRGVFFSAHQPEKTLSSGTGTETVFIHDLFDKILPQERSLVTPTRRAIQWRRFTGNLGAVCWIILSTAMCVLLSVSFLQNASTVRHISREVSQWAGTGSAAADLHAMDRYRQTIVAVEEQNRHRWLPQLGLAAGVQVEQAIKRCFCRKFHDGFLASHDKDLHERIAALLPTVSDDVYGEYVVHLSRRINLLKALQRGQRCESLKGMPQPIFVKPGLSSAGTTGDVSQTLGPLYISYLSWRDHRDLAPEIGTLQDSLKHLLALKSGELKWVAAWVDRHGRSAAINFADFWGGHRHCLDEKVISPAFTRGGKDEMEAVISEVESAHADQQLRNPRKVEFQEWYRLARYAAWESFAIAFPRGRERLRGEREWQEVAAKMPTEQSPYAMLLNRLALELGNEAKDANLPSWLKQLYRLQMLKESALAGESGSLRRAADDGKKLVVSLQKKIGNDASARKLDDAISGSNAYREYRSALTAVAPVTASPGQAYQAAVQLYTQDANGAKSPLVVAFAAARQLQTALGSEAATHQALLQLIIGPVDFLHDFLLRETSAHLQSQWEEQVVSATVGMTGQQAGALLLGTDGLVWRFVKGPAAPFLGRSLNGYRAKEIMGRSLGFETSFCSFLDRGSKVQAAAMTKQQNYSVGIEGLPTDANQEARIKPQATRLELQCGASSQSLVNHNYPVGKTFSWAPDSCGDVVLQIEIADLVLTRRYAGPQAFPEFLNSFAGGHHSFSLNDFPGERKALENMGIKRISVNYRFIGSGPVIKQMTSVCGEVPRRIAKCWSE